MVKEVKKNEIGHRSLPERALSTVLAGVLAMSVCGTTMVAFATEYTDPSEAGVSEVDKALSIAFVADDATVYCNGRAITGHQAVTVSAQQDLIFTVAPREGFTVEEVSLQLLNEGVLDVLRPTQADNGAQFAVAADRLAEGMAIVIDALAVAVEEASDLKASELESLPVACVLSEREAAAMEAAAAASEAIAGYAPSYKTMNVKFISRGTAVDTVKAVAGGFVTMPECPGEASFTQTIYACRDAAGNVRRTASLEKAQRYGSYEPETVTYSFLGWSNKSDYGSLSTSSALYDSQQNDNLYAAGQRVFCDSLNVDGAGATLYAVWKQTEGPYFAGESIDTRTGGNALGGDGVYRVSIALLHNSNTVPVEPSVLSAGYPVKEAGYSDTEKYFTLLYRDAVGSTDGSSAANSSLGQYNPLDHKLTLDRLVKCAVTTTDEESVNAILTDEFHAIVADLNANGDGTYKYWNPATQRVIWYVVKEQRESYWNGGEMCIGWHIDGMVVDADAPSVDESEHAGRSVSYTLRYDANCNDYAGALPLSTVHEAVKNGEGEPVASASVANPSEKVFVANNSKEEPVFTDGMTRPGFAFVGWAETPAPGADDPIYAPTATIELRGNATLYAQWESMAGTYTMKHYLQNDDGTYTCAKSDSFEGKVGEQVQAQAVEYPQYALNESVSTLTGIILGGEASGNQLVLNLFYDRTMPITGTTREPSAKVKDVEKVYDGQPVCVEASAEKGGSTLLYYTDGMKGWSTENPRFTEAGSYTVLVKATNPDNTETEVVTAHVTVKPAAVVIKVHDAEKTLGSADPAFEGTIEGLMPDDEIGTVVYYRVNNDVEEVGSYANALSALVQHRNGNYTYTVLPGSFTIKACAASPAQNPTGDQTASSDPSDPSQPAAVGSTLTEEFAQSEGMQRVIEGVVVPIATLLGVVNPDPTIIADDIAPLAAFEGNHQESCWVHPWIIFGAFVTAVGGAIAIVRRLRQTWHMDDDLDEVCSFDPCFEEEDALPALDGLRTW